MDRSSSVTVTPTAIGSVSSTKVLMPCLQENGLVLRNKTSNTVQFMSRKATIFCQRNRVEPKLGDSSLSFHMNVRWLALVGTEKYKAIWATLKHRRHSSPEPFQTARAGSASGKLTIVALKETAKG